MTVSTLFRECMDWVGTSVWPERHFERLYSRTVDPWHCEVSPYERLKTERTRDAVRDHREVGSVADIGCGEGILADMLGELGYSVRGYEISWSAARRAQQRCARHGEVAVVRADVRRRHVTLGCFDVIVVSEVLYYLGHGRSRNEMCEKIARSTASQGHVIAVNGWPSATAVERPLASRPELEIVDQRVFPDRGRPYAITVYRRRG